MWRQPSQHCRSGTGPRFLAMSPVLVCGSYPQPTSRLIGRWPGHGFPGIRQLDPGSARVFCSLLPAAGHLGPRRPPVATRGGVPSPLFPPPPPGVKSGRSGSDSEPPAARPSMSTHSRLPRRCLGPSGESWKRTPGCYPVSPPHRAAGRTLAVPALAGAGRYDAGGPRQTASCPG